MNAPAQPHVFTSYQKFVIAMLAFLQFTIILDFMIMSPLGALLMPALSHHAPRNSAWWSRPTPSARASRASSRPASPISSIARSSCCSSTPASCWAPSCAASRPRYKFAAGGARRHRHVRRRHRLHLHGHHHRHLPHRRCAAASWASSRPPSRPARCSASPSGSVLANRWGWHAPFLMIVAVSACRRRSSYP